MSHKKNDDHLDEQERMLVLAIGAPFVVMLVLVIVVGIFG